MFSNYSILAALEIDPQVILVVLILFGGAIKWIFENIISKKPKVESSELDDIYAQFREEITERQTSPAVIQRTKTPPPIEPTAATHAHSIDEPVSLSHTLNKAERDALEKIRTDSFAVKYTGSNQPPTQTLKSLLIDKQSVRRAIVAKEILGQPKAFSKDY